MKNDPFSRLNRHLLTLVTAVLIATILSLSITLSIAWAENHHTAKGVFPNSVTGQIIVKFKDGANIGEVAGELLNRGQRFESVTRRPGLDLLNERFRVRKIDKLFKFQGSQSLQGAVIDQQKSKDLMERAKTRHLRRVEDVKKRFMGRTARIPRNVHTPYLGHIYRVEFDDPDIDILAACEEYAKDPDVEYAEPNYLAHTTFIPSDARYSEQWAHQVTEAEEGWDIQRGSGDIVIAVVDTGIAYDHEDLTGNMLGDCTGGCPSGRGYDFVDIDTQSYVDEGDELLPGEDYTAIDNDPSDYNGHGTHCAGIAAGVGHNGIGIAGVCMDCSIMPVRAGFSIITDGSEHGLLEYDDIANALTYAADHGADVISMSFGGDDSSTMQNAVDYAYSLGVVLVASAGNKNTSDPNYPAAYSNVIAVAATADDDTRAYYSSYGSWVDVAAPGGDSHKDTKILSTVPFSGGCNTHSSGYKSLQGTSMAAPYVAGIAGLILSSNGGWTNQEIMDIIRDSVDSISSSYYIGTGRVNVRKAVENNVVVLSLPSEVTEGDGVLNGQGSISVAANPEINLVVSLSSSDASELTVPETVTIPAGATTQTFDVTVIDDDLLDGPQEVLISCSTAGYPSSVSTVIVYDNETATLTVDIPETASEGDGVLTGQGLVSVSATVDGDVTISLESDDTTEVTVPDEVIIPAGQSSATFDLTIVEDPEIDGIQTATVTASVIGWASGSDSIDVEDDETRELFVSLPETVSEGDGLLSNAGRIFISGTFSSDLIVNMTSDDTTELTVPLNVTIPSGQTEAFFDISVIDDALLDGTQSVTVSASAAGWTPSSGTINIQDNEAGSLQFSASSYAVDEGGRSTTVTVVRTAGSMGGTVTVDYATSDGTATAGFDYASTSGTLTFAEGETSKSFSIYIMDDEDPEGDETVNLTLSNPTGGAGLAAPVLAVLTLNDNEGVSISLPYNLYDGDNYLWDIQKDGRILDGTSDAYDGGHDYPDYPYLVSGILKGGREIVIGPVTISAFDVTRRIYVPQDHSYARFLEVIHNPGDTVRDCSVPIRTNLGSNYSTVLVGTSDGDASFTTQDNWIVTDDDDGTGDPTIMHVIANDYGDIKPSSVSAPTGYVYYTFDLTMLPGETKIIMHFGAQGQNCAIALEKANQLVHLELEALAMLTKIEINQIVNFKKPNALFIWLPESVSEGAGVLQDAGILTIPKAPEYDLTVSLTSGELSEISVPPTVTIPAGQTEATFDVTVLDDSLLDGMQSITITSSASGYFSDTGVIEVNDNETAMLTVDVPENVGEGDGVLIGQGTVDISAVVGKDVRIFLSSSEPSKVKIPEYVTVPAGQSTNDFDLSIIDDMEIEGTQTVSINVSVPGWTGDSAVINLADNESKIIYLSLPEKTNEDAGVLTSGASVHIQGTYASDLVIDLSSDDTSEVVVPDSTTIPSGQTMAAFDMTIIDDGILDGDQNVTITASAPGWTSGSDTIIVGEDYRKGSEFQVNTDTLNAQFRPSVAGLEGGGFVVTWQSYGQDGSYDGIFGQRYDGSGNKVGSEFQINTHWSSDQENPSVAGVEGGGFVVTWQSYYQDGSRYGIYGQRYDGSGNELGNEFQINTHSSSDQESPSVAGLQRGGFVVVWASAYPYLNFPSIYGQRYDGSGNELGSEFQINTHWSSDQESPSVAGLEDGGFVVTWQSDGQDGSDYGIYGQVYDSSGNTVGSEFRCNTGTIHDQENPSVAGLENGGFVVTWQSYYQDGSGYGIYGQRFDESVNTVGNEFRCNTGTIHDQENPSVTSLKGCGFIVTWQSKYQDGNLYGIYGQRYDSSGNTFESEFRCNTYTSANQENPSVTGLEDGDFVVTWQSDGQDGDDYGVYGQRFVTDFIKVSMYEGITEGDGILSGQGTVSVTFAPLNDLAVHLHSDDLSELLVPAVVTIPAGETSQTFDITVIDDDLLDGPQKVAVSSSAEGYPSSTGFVFVNDNETATVTVELPEAASEGDGILLGQGMVTLSAPGDNVISVQLKSGDRDEVLVPRYIDIPGGQNSVLFDLTIGNDLEIDGTQAVTITAEVAGWPIGNDTIMIEDNDAFLTVDVLSLLNEGDGIVHDAGTVSIVDTIDSDLVIDLNSDDISKVTVPSSVTISAGETLVTFDVTVLDNTEIEGTKTLTITATAQGFDSGTADIMVRDNDNGNSIPAWTTYQGNPSHTGYVPGTVLPTFTERWVKPFGEVDLNPVAAADGRVFVTTRENTNNRLIVINAANGDVLWEKDFCAVPSVSPPACDDGIVYVQTAQTDSGDGPYLRAYDVTTGDLIFQNPFSAQWQKDYAPTIFDGKVYVNGGADGGVFAFDGLTGEQLWFSDLDPYDQWTPAVNADYVFACTGGYMPDLDVINRQTGVKEFTIAGSIYKESGSMYLAPILGSENNVIVRRGDLISYDLETQATKWRVSQALDAQPSVAHGQIYAIDYFLGDLVVMDESDGSLIWSWDPPSSFTGSSAEEEGIIIFPLLLSGTMVVTDSHLFASTNRAVHALDLNTRSEVWRYPAFGKLALSEGVLYIATPDSTLVAIDVVMDSDGDGIVDTLEYTVCGDPADADSDDDGIPDGVEDANQNGIVDPGETDPCNPDTDGDGIQDGTESGVTEGVPDPDGAGPLQGTDLAVFISDEDSGTTTDPLNPDSDGDGLTDGQEDLDGDGMVDDGERDPGVRDMTFDTNSDQISNLYSPFVPHENMIYVGTGSFENFERYTRTLGTELVDSVACRRIRIKGYGNAADPEDDPEWYEGWIAQDTDGVVWLFQTFDAQVAETTLFGQADAVVWMPAAPVVEQTFRQLGGDFCKVEETDIIIPVLSTGLGPYDHALKVFETLGGTDQDAFYFAPTIGCVKEKWNDGGEMNGWDLKEILVEPASDFDFDADVDGVDLAVFVEDFGRYDCTQADPCEGDFDGDGDVDEDDLAVFAAEMGWVGLP